MCQFLEDDQYIYEKLYEIRNKIALLDEIKQKGNVEVSSIKQANCFNETNRDVEANRKFSIEHVILRESWRTGRVR